jgi:hypothetical protein
MKFHPGMALSSIAATCLMGACPSLASGLGVPDAVYGEDNEDIISYKHNPDLKEALQALAKSHKKRSVSKVGSALSDLDLELKAPWVLEASSQPILQAEGIRRQLQSVLDAKYWAGSLEAAHKGDAAKLLGDLAAQRVTPDETRKKIEATLFQVLANANVHPPRGYNEKDEEENAVYTGALAGLRDMASVSKMSASGFGKLKSEYNRMVRDRNFEMRNEVVKAIGGIRPKSKEVRDFLIELTKPPKNRYLRAVAARGLEDWSAAPTTRAFNTLFKLAADKGEFAEVREAALNGLLGGYNAFTGRQGKPKAALEKASVLRLLNRIKDEKSTGTAHSSLIATAESALKNSKSADNNSVAHRKSTGDQPVETAEVENRHR